MKNSRITGVGSSPVIPKHADDTWLLTLPDCSMHQFRKKVTNGGIPIFQLDESSVQLNPVWRLLIQDGSGVLWRVRTKADPIARRLISIRQVYQIARNAGLPNVFVPAEQRK
jgi:hypothetical protein